MMRQMNFSPFLCGLIFVLFWGSVTPRPKSGLSLAMLRQSEEVGRLRRGFQTSSLATARGFGKRSRTVCYFVTLNIRKITVFYSAAATTKTIIII
ncbi:hypothetical protein Anas_05788 [Armadillidium nasatum]|uniref:Secreted protein n=1 Tax=Armadillidium nasatum TaxID=96803 RepID=A0A5N5TLQ2_9CRUS|nr:hypothetical protein Anas_05788 [Armadillidium nasatum]